MDKIIISILLGAVSGWIASKIMKTGGGIIRNVILGIIGGFVGGLVFGLIGIGANNYLGTIVISVVGACIVIFVAKLISK